MTQFVHPLLTDDQALMAATAIRLILEDEEKYVFTDEERDQFTRLAGFFGLLAEHPSQFPPKGAMVSTVKRITRRAKGAAQPQSRSTRKAKRSQGRQKRDRAARREQVAQYNASLAAYEKDMRDAEEAHRELEEQLSSEPRVQVIDVNGRVIMSEIPASMVVPMDEEKSIHIGQIHHGDLEHPGTKLILPGNVEKAMEREAAE